VSSPEIFLRCNHTELYQLCHKVGINVTPDATREQMANLLMGEEPDPVDVEHPIHSWRHGLAGFVLDHWQALRVQVVCPLRSKDPMACFGCPDTRVIACINMNPNNEKIIDRYRK
jgi:hypothetical protein